MRKSYLLSLVYSLFSFIVFAQNKVQSLDTIQQLDEVIIRANTILGNQFVAKNRTGSAYYISSKELTSFSATDISQVLSRVPGINFYEEDGFGLRPNLSIRGTSPQRSSKITLMEDGVLIAPAPYAAPSAYYFPTAGRMSAIEVRKGSAAVKFGPRTVGGALNLVSTPIPEETGGKGDFRFGSDDFYVVHVNGAYVGEKVAAFVETYQSGSDGFKKLDGGGDTGFSI